MVNGLKTAVLLAVWPGSSCSVVPVRHRWPHHRLVLLSLAMIGGSYRFSDRLAIRSARAVEIDPVRMPEYHAIMVELTRVANMPMPRLYVSPEQQPNAFRHRPRAQPCRSVCHRGSASGADVGRDPRGVWPMSWPTSRTGTS